MLMPLKNASGSQISEQTECQKLSRTESRLMKASTLSTQFCFCGMGRGLAARPACRRGYGDIGGISAVRKLVKDAQITLAHFEGSIRRGEGHI